MNKIFERISLRQSIYISKRISFLLEAGVSLPDAFSLVAGQMKKRGVTLAKIATDISRGLPITEVISKAGIFGNSALPMIKIGEESGVLAESFSALSDELEKRAELKQKIIGAMLYPACITVGMLVLVVVLMTIVFPKMLGVFKSLHVTLPLSTRVLIFVSDFIRRFGLLFGLIIIAGIVIGMVLFRRYENFRFNIDHLIMKVPMLSALVQAYTLASVSNVVGLLMSNGSSLVAALSVAGDTCSNLLYRRAFKSVVADVLDGAALGYSLSKYPKLFPQEFSDIISIGERTGKLSETFIYAHNLYSRDLDSLTKSLSASIEPVLMVFIGLAIGVVAFSVVTPMYSITSHLNTVQHEK